MNSARISIWHRTYSTRGHGGDRKQVHARVILHVDGRPWFTLQQWDSAWPFAGYGWAYVMPTARTFAANVADYLGLDRPVVWSDKK